MGSALIISLRKRRIRCPTRSKHRLYLPFVRQKRGGLPKGPLHVRRGGPFGGQCPLPCPAQEACVAGGSAPGRGHTQQRPLALGSARCLVRPKRSALPETVPRGEAIHISALLSLGSARCLFRPIFLCCSLYHAPGLFPCLFIFSLAGPARRRSPARFLLAKKGRIFVPLYTVD